MAKRAHSDWDESDRKSDQEKAPAPEPKTAQLTTTRSTAWWSPKIEVAGA